MNLPPNISGDSAASPSPSPPKREVQLQGPRPSPLKINLNSHKIKKPPTHPPPRHQPPPPPPPRHPLIIYAVSPKVIHATTTTFMSIVQRLTGPNPTLDSPAPTAGALSPAARFAAIEKTSPPAERRFSGDGEEGLLVGDGVEVGGFFPGILSPAPASLAPIPAGFFSPAADMQTLSLVHDWSPILANSGFLTSPSSLLVSPSPCSLDIFNLFDS